MHTKSAVVRRDTGIKSIASSFNRHIDTMQQLKSSTPQYRLELVPSKIDLKNIFQVDVFSALWDEWGLVSSDQGEERWKTDGETREAIRLLLEIDRCKEERERLAWEVSRLASWANSLAVKVVEIYESIGGPIRLFTCLIWWADQCLPIRQARYRDMPHSQGLCLTSSIIHHLLV